MWILAFVLGCVAIGLFVKAFAGPADDARPAEPPVFDPDDLRATMLGKDEQSTPFLRGDGSYSVAVVGESHYQDALEAVCGGRTEDGADLEIEATLALEDKNRFDPNAVRVDINGAQVGYLDRYAAKSFRDMCGDGTLPAVAAFRCRAHITGGWDRGDGDRGHFGVRLDVVSS